MKRFILGKDKKELITPNQEAEKLVEYAWKMFCRDYPKAIESAENLGQYRAIWKVGYYFSLHPMFMIAKQKLEALLEFASDGKG